MQSLFLMAAAAYCIRAAALWGKERGWMPLKNYFCCLRVVGDVAFLENTLVGNLKLEGAYKESSIKGNAM